VDQGLVYILDEQKDELVSLNETASFLWLKLSSPLSREKLIKLAQNNLEANPRVIEKDVIEFVEKLKKRNFLIRK